MAAAAFAVAIWLARTLSSLRVIPAPLSAKTLPPYVINALLD